MAWPRFDLQPSVMGFDHAAYNGQTQAGTFSFGGAQHRGERATALFFDREYGEWELLVPDRRVVPMPEITDSLYLIPEGDLSIPAIDVDEFATEALRLAGMG